MRALPGHDDGNNCHDCNNCLDAIDCDDCDGMQQCHRPGSVRRDHVGCSVQKPADWPQREGAVPGSLWELRDQHQHHHSRDDDRARDGASAGGMQWST